MRMLDTPNPFTPRSEMLAFLRECEEIKDHDPHGQVREAMEKVQGYLAQPDPREAEAKQAASARKKSAD
jgi:hypothetical protein